MKLIFISVGKIYLIENNDLMKILGTMQWLLIKRTNMSDITLKKMSRKTDGHKKFITDARIFRGNWRSHPL